MNHNFLSWSIFILLCFIWGSSFILMSYSKDWMPASQIAALRIFAGAMVFLPFAFFSIRRIPRQKLGLVLLSGIFGNLLPAYMFAIAIARQIDSSLAGILNSLTPICVVLIGILFFRDRIRRQKIIGVFTGFAGLFLLTLVQSRINLENAGYAGLILVGTISYGVNVNMVSHYLKTLHPIHTAIVSLAFMAIPTGILLWLQGFFQMDFSSPGLQWALLATALLGIVGSAIATALFYILVQRAGGLFASMVTYGIPFVALFWGFMDGEKITPVEIFCLGIILWGVWLANRPEKKLDD
ncbi:MAG TPA: DMT family transporter [Chitinophagaceae bacterium]|nr:DMT family transporter [Chitinophagaceae bacterium]